MMDAEERALFAQAVDGAVAQGDAGLDAIGWADALATDPRTAVSAWFETQGYANATSSALNLILVTVRGQDLLSGLQESEREAMARRALAHELIGASRAMLELARTHALDRIQFGVPIASFQAVRHRLAETLVGIEAADAAAGAAWDDDTPLGAAMAKAIAGRSARTAARHCQQVLAGIGFTAEHPFHRYFRRVLELDLLLGDHRRLTREVGEVLLRDRAMPPVLPL